MRLPKLPNPGSLIEAKYTAAQMKAYALKAAMAENEICEKLVENYALGYAEPTWAFKLIDLIRARRTT